MRKDARTIAKKGGMKAGGQTGGGEGLRHEVKLGAREIIK